MIQVVKIVTSRRSLAAFVLMVAAAGLACAPQAADQGPELSALTDRWEEALNSGDAEGIAALYTEDCVLMPPNEALGKGQAFAKASFQGMIDAGLTGGLDSMVVAAAGGIGYHAGTYRLNAPDGSLFDRGKYMEAWKKVDGEWKIAYDIWNSDLVPGAGTTTIAITHDVKDADHWLAAWQGENSRHQLFAEHGAAKVRVFQNPENPTQTGLLVDVTDMEALQALLNSEEGAAAKAADGVKDNGMRTYVEMK